MYTLVCEENDFLIVNKHANVSFHSTNGEPGLASKIAEDGGSRLYPIHRLDTVTSGLLIFAKSKSAARTFGELFSNHLVQKYYLAIAKGKPKKKQGAIVGDMAKSRRGRFKLLRSRSNPAVTQFFSTSLEPGLRLYLLKPLSGKTHQLRVAMTSLGTPILGDVLYGGERADRTYLHAWYLEFEYGGKSYVVSTALDSGDLAASDGLNAQVCMWEPPSALSWPVLT